MKHKKINEEKALALTEFLTKERGYFLLQDKKHKRIPSEFSYFKYLKNSPCVLNIKYSIDSNSVYSADILFHFADFSPASEERGGVYSFTFFDEAYKELILDLLYTYKKLKHLITYHLHTNVFEDLSKDIEKKAKILAKIFNELDDDSMSGQCEKSEKNKRGFDA